jgi:hypothetical protein
MRRGWRAQLLYTCAVIGGLSALVAVVATLSGSWTPMISNDSGAVSIGGLPARCRLCGPHSRREPRTLGPDVTGRVFVGGDLIFGAYT